MVQEIDCIFSIKRENEANWLSLVYWSCSSTGDSSVDCWCPDSILLSWLSKTSLLFHKEPRQGPWSSNTMAEMAYLSTENGFRWSVSRAGHFKLPITIGRKGDLVIAVVYLGGSADFFVISGYRRNGLKTQDGKTILYLHICWKDLVPVLWNKIWAKEDQRLRYMDKEFDVKDYCLISYSTLPL